LAIILQLSGCLNLALGLAGMLITPASTLSQGAVLVSVGVFGFMLGRLWLWMLNRKDKQIQQQYAQRIMHLGRGNSSTILGPGLIRPASQSTMTSSTAVTKQDRIVPIASITPPPNEVSTRKDVSLRDFNRQQGSVMADEPDLATEVKRISGLDPH
jgi:hypothetical protein